MTHRHELKEPLGELPVASTSLDEEVGLLFDGDVITLSFLYTIDCLPYSSHLRFDGVRAFRYRAERFCTEWEIRGAYDTVVEIRGSRWLADLTAVATKLGKTTGGLRHFMIYIDSAGCYEVLGSDWAMSPPARAK